ncbi:unnamed protein product [Polarella glacialis]|uniref:Uncharacterized protein n=1 Tax=Polarella glacialis TaxID=89957 RepID=A0A813GX91_POLGL|nr:unnamed protein product [Polarella glacialis]
MDVNDGRHFQNSLDCNVEPPDWEAQLHQAMTQAETAVLAGRHSTGSIYTGAAGAAYALLHLASCGLREPAAAAAEALRRLPEAEAACDNRRATLLEGPAGCVALEAWAQQLLGDTAAASKSVVRLGKLAACARDLPAQECEVLYGRCGFLGAILLVRQRLGDAELLAAQAAELVAQVVAEGKRAACDDWPLYFEWHGTCYLGGAHGMCGILLTLLQLPAELALAGPDAAQLVRATTERLLKCRFKSGNLSSSLGSRQDRLVHWCHGSTGLVMLLLRLGTGPDAEGYLALAKEAGEVVWRRGLLSTKGLGLCHGIPGNGYALLALHRATGDSLWLRRALHFAVFAAKHESDLAPLADRPLSLFEGLAGALCFWAEALRVASGQAGTSPGSGSPGESSDEFSLLKDALLQLLRVAADAEKLVFGVATVPPDRGQGQGMASQALAMCIPSCLSDTRLHGDPDAMHELSRLAYSRGAVVIIVRALNWLCPGPLGPALDQWIKEAKEELSAEAAEGADDPDVPEANVGGDAESKSSNAGIKEDDKAKEAYRTGDYAAAVKAWTRSLSSVKYLLEKDLYKHNPAQEKEVEGMELRLCLNLAQVHLKLSEWGQAVTFADKALVRDARNAKALYRKASALMELMSYSEAIEVLGRLLEFEPSNSAAVAMLAKANRSASLSEVRERRQAKKIFAGIERDSRVPPTEWEVFVDSVREAVADCFGQLEGKLGVRCPCRRSRSRAPGVDGDKKD